MECFKPEQSCRAQDWVVVESGEDVKWKGQARRLTLTANQLKLTLSRQVISKKGGQLRVRWLKVWEPEDDDEVSAFVAPSRSSAERTSPVLVYQEPRREKD